MAWALLVLGGVGLAVTISALHPVRRLALLTVPSFVFGWPTSEAALHLLALELVISAVFAAAGALEHWPGWLGLGLCIASWAALLFLHSQGHAAAGVMERSLSDALGPDYRRRLAKVYGVDSPLPAGRMVLPLWLVDPAVDVTRDVPYLPGGGRRQQLDIYSPRKGVRHAPVLFQIHGGGWVIGHKAQQARPEAFRVDTVTWLGALGSA